jgi:hypothetical protein
MHRSKQLLYSITWSAASKIEAGIVTPMDLAVFIFSTNSKCVGCSTGKSAGEAPARILST